VTSSDHVTAEVAALGLRPVRDDDAAGLITLIGGVYAEYPGCVLDLDGVDADLRSMASYLAGVGGQMWVKESDTGLVACVGWAPTILDGRPAVELKRLYVAPSHRRQGLGRRLVELVESVAVARGAGIVELWSDQRFTDAHALYARLGFERQPETRHLNDPSDTTELHFVEHVTPRQ
jgi:putative acetyltransferase